MFQKKKIRKAAPQFTRKILRWFADHRRDLPWRETKDPYKIWVSEIMLQQTQVDRVIGYYQRFLERFPDVRTLSDAKWEDLLEVWRGLGYYHRARNMQKAAQMIVEKFSGRFPDDIRVLKLLPGIGEYTAHAVASFAFGQDVPTVDTNISRVVTRVFGDVSPWERMGELLPEGESSMFNQGVMELGALVCGKVPQCGKCPLRGMCEYYVAEKSRSKLSKLVSGVRDFAVESGAKLKPLLVAEKKSSYHYGTKNPVVRVAAGLVHRKGKLLITQRRKGTHLAGFWNFPGGKLEVGESERACLKREIIEELGVEVSVRPAFFKTRYTYEDRTVVITFHRCQVLLGEPRGLEKQALKWVGVDELGGFDFPPADKEVLKLIRTMRW